MSNDTPTSPGANELNARQNSAHGINAVHVNAAREMVSLHTRNRLPNGPKIGTRAPPGTSSKAASNPLASRSKPPASDGRAPPPNDTIFSRMPSKPAKIASSFATPGVSVPAKSEKHCTNPQCDHCGMVIIPSPKATFPIQDAPSITVHDWSIYTTKRPILSSKEIDHYESRFNFPMPEMIFGNNSVRLVNDRTQSIIEFNAIDALSSLSPKSDFKVSYHKEWLESRRSNTLSSESSDAKAEKAFKENSNKDLNSLMDMETVKDYDWTYSPNYKASLSNIEFRKTDKEFPIKKLLRPDPILFFDESVLFEDELGDNGISVLSTKIRVMPSCLLLLCRFFLRIDNVNFRVRDVRVFIDFETNEVLREYKQQDCNYNAVANKISVKTSNDPKSLLRDANYIAQNIPVVSCELEEGILPAPAAEQTAEQDKEKDGISI